MRTPIYNNHNQKCLLIDVESLNKGLIRIRRGGGAACMRAEISSMGITEAMPL